MQTGQPAATVRNIVRLSRVGTEPGMRALAWQGNVLYASRGYQLFRKKVGDDQSGWESVGDWSPSWWRTMTSATRLSSRLVRDGFHALTVLAPGKAVAAVPGAILQLEPGQDKFRVTHQILRGSRPLHIAATPAGAVYWGEYFDNAERDEVHVYGSHDGGVSWGVVHTFPKGSIRHVHNMVYDRWGDCLWVLTGDYGEECRVLRVSSDFRHVEVVLSGNQQARAVAMVPAEDGLYFATDTPLEQNFIYRMERDGRLERLSAVSSSCIEGCAVGRSIFFSTMVEPSEINRDVNVRVYGSSTGTTWEPLLAWKKDAWPMRFFQYGNAWLPSGENASGHLAVSTVAVEGADLTTSFFRVE